MIILSQCLQSEFVADGIPQPSGFAAHSVTCPERCTYILDPNEDLKS